MKTVAGTRFKWLQDVKLTDDVVLIIDSAKQLQILTYCVLNWANVEKTKSLQIGRVRKSLVPLMALPVESVDDFW